MLRIAIVVAVLLAFPVAYLFVLHGKSGVIEEITDITRRSDVDAAAALVDWEHLRGFLKEDIAGQKKKMGSYAASVGPAEEMIGKIVDYYVLPENIDILFYYRELLFPQAEIHDFIHSEGFYPPFGFQVTLGYPKSLPARGDMSAVLRDKMTARLVFRLDGFSWKLKEAHVPLFMVPKQIHEARAVKLLGRP